MKATAPGRDGSLDTTVALVSSGSGEGPASERVGPSSVDAFLAAPDGPGGRYALRAVLGRGGMGEVRLCRDNRIGREVALKVVLPDEHDRGSAHERFLHEARLQGQLEHPAIVPVYDVGVDADQQLYFTMRRVRGDTLEAIIAGLAAGEAPMIERYSRRKLLSAFVNVCLAIDYAHSRGVVHRDLKPSNIMLGPFGEVYVLDWGIAKVAAEPERAAEEAPREDASREEALALPDARTRGGKVYGTMGYMAPEQIEGKPALPPADVYSLGAILFELLALERVHVGSSLEAVLGSTLRGADPRPSHRARGADLPPELDEICARALARDPAERHASARELSLAIERYLDGDRNLELRREMAPRHADAAVEAAAAIGGSGAEAKDARVRAMKEVSRALALDPDDPAAVRTLVELLTQPPREMPAEAARDLDAAQREHARIAARGAVFIYLGSAVLYGAFIAWMGVRDLTWAALMLAGFVIAAVLSHLDGRRSGTDFELAVLAASLVSIFASSRMFGPAVLLPTFAMGNTLGFALTPNKRRRALFIGAGCLVVVLPALLEGVGLLGSSYRYAEGSITLVPQMHALPTTSSAIAWLVITLASIIGAALFTGDLRDALTSAQREIHLHAWQLRQLLPPTPPRSP